MVTESSKGPSVTNQEIATAYSNTRPTISHMLWDLQKMSLQAASAHAPDTYFDAREPR